MPDRIPTTYFEPVAVARSTREQTLHASAAITANGNSGEIIVGDYTEGLLDINISAVSGTSPTLDFKLQTFINGNWRDTGLTIAQQTATGAVTSKVTNFGEKVRLAWTIGGTGSPSFTFSSTFLAKS